MPTRTGSDGQALFSGAERELGTRLPLVCKTDSTRWRTKMASGERAGRRGARWFAAGLLLAGLAVTTAVSASTTYLRVCSLSPADGELCRAMLLSDPPVVAVFALAGLLLLPDLSKVKIGGVLELEGMIAETSRKVEASDAKIERVLQQVSTLSLANSQAGAAAASSQNLNVVVNAQTPADLDEDLMARKAKEGLGVD